MPTTIYALCKPDLQVPVIRYIGKTIEPKKRFWTHLHESFKLKSHLGNWLKGLANRGEEPVIMLLTEVPDELGSTAEILYIRLAREGGMDLCNLTDGGDGVTMTPEIREKIGASKLGKPRGPHSPAHCAAISASLQGTSPSLACQEARILATKGVPHSQERRRVTSEVCSGDKNGFFGRAHTPEQKLKWSKDRRGFCRAPRQVFKNLPFFVDGGGI